MVDNHRIKDHKSDPRAPNTTGASQPNVLKDASQCHLSCVMANLYGSSLDLSES